jgi:aromatic ring-opening dioxygenase LigB subunit
VPLVVITPARDLSAEDHIKAGAAVGAAARESGLRVAFIASADHGHAHDPQGPYGFDPAAKRYDQLICDIVRDDHLNRLVEIPLELVESQTAGGRCSCSTARLPKAGAEGSSPTKRRLTSGC